LLLYSTLNSTKDSSSEGFAGPEPFWRFRVLVNSILFVFGGLDGHKIYQQVIYWYFLTASWPPINTYFFGGFDNFLRVFGPL
jgi:hypothetical protein